MSAEEELAWIDSQILDEHNDDDGTMPNNVAAVISRDANHQYTALTNALVNYGLPDHVIPWVMS